MAVEHQAIDAVGIILIAGSRVELQGSDECAELLFGEPTGLLRGYVNVQSPRLLGRKGERVAKTPIRSLPPRRGGLTVGVLRASRLAENSQMIHR